MKGLTSIILLVMVALVGITAGGAVEAQAGCRQWVDTNGAHARAGRAYSQSELIGCTNVVTYYAVGSDENLGSQDTTTSLITEDGRTYKTGFCPGADWDEDGHAAEVDCDDNNASVHPDAEEICGDTIDQDCDGSDLSCPNATCQMWGVPLDEHVEAGRVHTTSETSACETTVSYYAVGSDIYLGTNGTLTVYLYTLNDGRTYQQGRCPDDTSTLSWRSFPETISNSAAKYREIVFHQVAMNAEGKAVAVWVERNINPMSTIVSGPDLPDQIWGNSYNGSTWGSAVMIAESTGDFSNLRIAINNTGNTMAAWKYSEYKSDIEDTVSKIQAARFNGETWATVPDIRKISTYNAGAVAIAMDASGNAIAVWEELNVTTFTSWNLWSRRFDGTQWSLPQPVEDGPDGVSIGQLVPGTDGKAVLIWELSGKDPRVTTVQVSRFDGSAWGTPVQISSASEYGLMYPEIAIDANDHAVAVWTRIVGRNDGSPIYEFQSNRFDGSAWGTPVTLAENASNPSDNMLAMNSAGTAIVLYGQDGQMRSRVWNGSAWGEALTFWSTANDVYGGQIAMDSAGKAIAVWNGGGDTLVRRFNGSAWWGTTELISHYLSGGPESTGGGGETYVTPKSPQLAINPDGSAIVIWQYGFALWNNRYE